MDGGGLNGDAAAAAGTIAYEDLVKLRQSVKGPLDYVVIHPNEMGDILAAERFLRADFITTLSRIAPSTTVFETKLGVTIYETEQATAGRVLGFSSRRAGRFTVKTRPRRRRVTPAEDADAQQRVEHVQRYDLGASGGPLQKGVTVWELINAVVTRGDAVAKCTV